MDKKRKLKDPQTLRIFFSSPFGGMEEEREELTRKYFPQFHHACKSKGVQFVAVDMRWGITSEAADNAQVINICLRELDRSDIFIGFFGQRYGWNGVSDKLLQKNFDNAVSRYPWVNKVRDKSVTELEFLHGHLNDPGALPVCICFRDKTYDDVQREEAISRGDDKTVFKYSAESQHSSQMMLDLIERIRKTEDKCLGVNLNYKNPHEGTKYMFETVFQTCQELLEGIEILQLSDLEQNRLCHDAFVSSLTSVFIDDEKNINRFGDYLESSKWFVQGPHGSGKSALLASLVDKIKKENQNINLIYHFVGSGPGTTDPMSILRQIFAELEHINRDGNIQENGASLTGIQTKEDEFGSDFHRIYLKVLRAMEKCVCQGKKILIMIDALDKVKSSEKTAKHLFWLPDKYPTGISVVLSSVSSDTATFDFVVSKLGFSCLDIKPLSPETQTLICQKSLQKSGKELSPNQLQRVVNAEQTKNPLFLKTFLGEVSIYGYFFSLDEKIDSLIYSNGIKDLLNKVLKRLEEDYNVREYSGLLVQQVLSAIAVSHKGLSERDLQEMFRIPSHVWSPFYFALESLLISHGGLLRFSFTEILEAVENRYFNTEGSRMSAMKTVVNYFIRILNKLETTDYLNNRILKGISLELPWIQKAIGDKKGIGQTISDVRSFHPLSIYSRYELIELWRESELSAEEMCTNLLASFDMAVSQLYLKQQEDGKKDVQPPGYVLLPILEQMKNFFADIHCYKPNIVLLERKISILEGVKGKNVPEDVRISNLRDDKYFYATAFTNDVQYKKGQLLLEDLKKECESCSISKTRQTLAFVCNGLGILHSKHCNFAKAEDYFTQAFSIFKELGNVENMAECNMNLGLVKMYTNEQQLAMEYFNLALESFEKFYFGHLPLAVANLYTNMAISQRRMGHLDEAERLYLRSLQAKVNAVGSTHEVVATTYMNLGTLETFRNNFAKAEEYARKAVSIHEIKGVDLSCRYYLLSAAEFTGLGEHLLEQQGNNIKLEQNEMWQSLENLADVLFQQNKKDEALSIFLRVFRMLKREDIIHLGLTHFHKEMMNHMLSLNMFYEVSEVLEAFINSPKLREATYFKVLDYCDRQISEGRPQRPEEQTVAYALRELYPGSNELTGYMIQTYLLPQKNVHRIIEMLDIMDKMNPEFLASTYKVGAIWCNGAQDWDAMVQVSQHGLEKYPEDQSLKISLFDGLRQLQQWEDAYTVMMEILPQQEDNQGLMLVAGHIALHCNNVTLSKELFEKVSTMPDEEMAQKAKDGLLAIADTEKKLEEESRSASNFNLTDPPEKT